MLTFNALKAIIHSPRFEKSKAIAFSLSSSESNNDDKKLQKLRIKAIHLLNTLTGRVGKPTKTNQHKANSSKLIYMNIKLNGGYKHYPQLYR